MAGEKLLNTHDESGRKFNALSEKGLHQITKMQNLSQNELDQIIKMENQSQDKLEKFAKLRRIKNYENMSRKELLNFIIKWKKIK